MPQGRRRPDARVPPARRGRSTSSSSTRSSRCQCAARGRDWPSCSRTPSATSTSPSSTRWRCSATRWASTCGRSSTAAATKPFGFMPFYPGPGVGGHCIPLDPTYLAWQVRRDAGRSSGSSSWPRTSTRRCRRGPSERIAEVAERTREAAERARRSWCWVSPTSPTSATCANPLGPGDGPADPARRQGLVPRSLHRGDRRGRHDHAAGGAEQTLAGIQRLVALLTPHSAYDLDWIAEHAPLVFDARNAYGPASLPNVVRL